MKSGKGTAADELVAKACEYWKSKGGRLTPARETVCRVIAAKNAVFDVEFLWDETRDLDQRISIAALYRIVASLLKAGFIREVPNAGGQRSFITVFPASTDAVHFRCRACGKIALVRNPRLDQVIGEMAGSHGFKSGQLYVHVEAECQSCGDSAA